MGGTRRGTRRVTQREAAEILGVSVEAIRKRIKRGTLPSEKGEDGRRYVFLDAAPDVHSESQAESGSTAPLVDVLRDEIAHLRRESERKDAIIMSLSQSNAELSRTIRAIEAPTEAREAPTEATEQPGRVEPQASVEGAQEGAEHRSWWQRWFGA